MAYTVTSGKVIIQYILFYVRRFPGIRVVQEPFSKLKRIS
jgi:hypothetical protein